MASQISQNYAKDCEAAVNKQINMELYSSYVYISMGVSLIDKTVVVLLEHEREKEMPSSFYFDRDDVALHHFAKFFKHQSHVYAEKLMKFQNRRGGRIVLKDIQKPEQDEWGNGLEAMQKALQLEKNINQSLLDLHKLAMDRNDPNLCDFLETYYLAEKVETIKEIGDHITNLKRLNVPENGMGEYLFEKHTLKKSD